MSWIPFSDQLEAINQIVQYLSGLPSTIMGLGTTLTDTILSLAYLIIYPCVLIIVYASFDVNYVWLIVVNLINVIIGIPNTGIAVLTMTFPASFPAPMLALIYVQFIIQAFIRSLAWLRFIYKNIPIVGGH